MEWGSALMLGEPALDAALLSLKLVTVHGPWWRVVAFRHLLKTPSKPLWAGGPKLHGARFTPEGSFDSLYLSTDPVTALVEANGLVILPSGPLPIRTPPLTLFAVNGVVTRVLDLTDAATLSALETNGQEMTGSWVKVWNPPTQILARAAYDSGRVAGIQYGSAKYDGRKNLMVFPDRLRAAATDYLEVYDPDGNLIQRIGA